MTDSRDRDTYTTLTIDSRHGVADSVIEKVFKYATLRIEKYRTLLIFKVRIKGVLKDLNYETKIEITDD